MLVDTNASLAISWNMSTWLPTPPDARTPWCANNTRLISPASNAEILRCPTGSRNSPPTPSVAGCGSTTLPLPSGKGPKQARTPRSSKPNSGSIGRGHSRHYQSAPPPQKQSLTAALWPRNFFTSTSPTTCLAQTPPVECRWFAANLAPIPTTPPTSRGSCPQG